MTGDIEAIEHTHGLLLGAFFVPPVRPVIDWDGHFRPHSEYLVFPIEGRPDWYYVDLLVLMSELQPHSRSRALGCFLVT